jgi:peptidyl-prolyl cis-trans isomerase SurA
MISKFLLIIGCITTLSLSAQENPVVIEVNNKKITKNEFLQIYLKNNPSPKFDKKSIDDYLELYKKFQLKVSEAEALGYDTIPKLKKELQGYRKSLATPYLIDKQENQKVVEEAYKRLQKEVKASHILIKVDLNANPDDTLKAYNKIAAIKKRIENGENFSKLAKELSEDPSAQSNAGNLGYFTAFQMVYPFEEAAYTTTVGNISSIVRTRFGYHILKVEDQRPARGIMKAAHIMISIKRDASDEELSAAKKKIEEIYQKLQAGEKFEDLALNFSDDPGSSDKGGKLPEFGSGTTTRMVPEFEEVAFQLKNNNDFSTPLQTDYGFHIIKRLDLSPLASFESMKKELQTKVNRDDRSKTTQNVLINKLKVEYTFTDVSKKGLKWFVKNLDSNYFKGKWNATKLKKDEVLFTLAGISFTQKQFANYLIANFRNVGKNENKIVVDKQFNNWVSAEILKYEDTQLEKKYPEFKALMQEYHDGVLLYEIMTDKVWNKANKDTLGLTKFYEASKANYTWKDRIDAVIYECLDKNIANQVTKMLKNDTITSKHILAKINEKSELNLKVKTNKYEVSEVPYLKNHLFKLGVNPIYEFGGKFYVVQVSKLIPSTPKLLSEAKGIITSDYQNFLEQQWLNELAKKYTFKINDSVIYSLGNN